MQGYNRSKEYIAAQGPVPGTVGDFWRMIWDYNIPTIVMLTNLAEKGKIKCSQYWPEDGHQEYANVDVTIVNTVTQADFVVRYFQIKHVSIIMLTEHRNCWWGGELYSGLFTGHVTNSQSRCRKAVMGQYLNHLL